MDNKAYLEYLLVCGKIDKKDIEKIKDLINSYMGLKDLMNTMYVGVLGYSELLVLLSKLNKYRELKKEELEFITTNMKLMQEVFGDSISYKLRIYDINYVVNEANGLRDEKLSYLKKKLNKINIKGLVRTDKALRMFKGKIKIKSKTLIIDDKEYSNIGHIRVLDKDNFELIEKASSKIEEDIDTLKITV